MEYLRQRQLEQVVVLVGGRGKRLAPITDSVPKPMAPVRERPFLDYLLESFVCKGFKEVVFLLGYKGEMIVDRYKNLKGLRTVFSHGADCEETGRRVLNAYRLLDRYFLLAYGDNYWPLPIQDMWNQYTRGEASVQTTIFSNISGTGEYGCENNVVLGKNGVVTKYDRTRSSAECNGLDIGYFIVDKMSLPVDCTENISFEEVILPTLIEKGKLSGYRTDTQYHYITDLEALQVFETVVSTESIPYLNDNMFFT